MIKNKYKNKIIYILLTFIIISFACMFLLNNKNVLANGNSYAFLSTLNASKGTITKKDSYINYKIDGEDSYIGIGTKFSPIDEPLGSAYSIKLEYRNTFFMHCKNNTDATKILIKFITSSDLSYDDEKSVIFDVAPNSDYLSYYFNLSTNIKASGYLRGFRIYPLDVSSGSIDIKDISFEREESFYDYAGNIISCISDGDVVTLSGTVEDNYKDKTIEIYRTDISNLSESIDGLTPIAKVKANGNNFRVKFMHYNEQVTNLSSKFIAVVDGIRIDKMCDIENYKDFTENPYQFNLNNITVKATDYGAKGDGFTDDTVSIQSAIDYVSSNGGGKVILSGDDTLYGKRYIATCIKLKDNVELNIEKGAIIWQSKRASDYSYTVTYGHDTVTDNWNNVAWSHAALCSNYPLIYGYEVDNIKITGEGKIRMEDTGSENTDYSDTSKLAIGCKYKIHLIPIGMYKCNNVEISDISIIRASAYHIAAYDVSNMYVGNVTLSEVADVGGDGISIGAGSKNIKIDCCDLYVTDDAIVLWSTSAGEPRDFWWDNIPNKDNRVMYIEIVHSYITGGHGITFIPWGTDANDLTFQEISDITIKDNILASGNTAIADWIDNPYYGASQGNSAGNNAEWDFSSIKNVTVLNNAVFGMTVLMPVPVTNLISDCGISSATNFSNAAFDKFNNANAGLAFWSYLNADSVAITESGVNGTKCAVIGDFESGTTKIYQGLYKTAGNYNYSADIKITDNATDVKMFVQNAITGEIIAVKNITNTTFVNTVLSFTISTDGVYYLGIDSGNSTNGYAYIDNANVTANAISGSTLFFENCEKQINNNITLGDFEVTTNNTNKVLSSNKNSAISTLNFARNIYSNFDFKANLTINNAASDIAGNFGFKFNETSNQLNFKYYYAYYDYINKTFKISKYNIGQETVLARAYNIELNIGQSYEIILKANSNGKISVYIDQILIIKYLDDMPIASGMFSFVNYYLSTSIDNLDIAKYDKFYFDDEIYDNYFTQNFENQNQYFDTYNWKKFIENSNTAISNEDAIKQAELNFNNSYDNFDFKLDIFINETSSINDSYINFKFNVNSNTFYLISYSFTEKNISIYKVTNGTKSLLSNKAITLKNNEWYTFGIRNNNSVLDMYINGEKFITVNDNEALNEGNISLQAINLKITVDDISIGAGNSLDFVKTRQDTIIEPIVEPKKGCKSNLANISIIISILTMGFVCIKRKKI